MSLKPLNEIIKLKPRPEGTFSLETAIKDGTKTVETYRFTNSIRDYFSEILELAASGRGQGYWIQAEYGAGKTHLLSTLGVLLSDAKGNTWNTIADTEIRAFKMALSGKARFLPVILNCKGRLPTEGSESSLQLIVERALEDACIQAGLRNKIKISSSDEILDWWRTVSQGLRADITRDVQRRFKSNPTPDELLENMGEEACAKALLEAAKALHINIPFTHDIRTRFNHIYKQLTKEHGYDGILFIIDEFKSWQDLHPQGSSGFAEDEHVLETLAFHLPVDDHARIITIVASQSAPPGKLKSGSQGGRFRTFTLFAAEEASREYDEIVAFRVREVISDRTPEVDTYYNHYFNHFSFLKHTTKEYFRETFPFQPRCLEVIRNITKRELATTRSSIHYVYEVLSHEETGKRRGLIKVSDLIESDNLITDLQSAIYKDAYTSFQSAQQALPTMFDEESDLQLAEDVLRTLFLWHCAMPDAQRGLTARELAEACLAADEDIGSEDLIHGIILQRLKELNQVEYTNKERGAFFRVSVSSGPTYPQILKRYQSKVSDENEAAPLWFKLITATTQNTEGHQMLFAGQTLDKAERAMGRANRIRYDGERLVVEKWHKGLGGPVVDKTNYAQPFRLVYLLEPAEVSADELNDDRIAVIIPASWQDVARDEMRRYAAVLRIEQDFAGQPGPEAEEIRQSNKLKKRELLTEIRLKQIEAYRRGRIVTKAGLALDASLLFAAPEKADEGIASALLSFAYKKPPFNVDAFKKEMTTAEPGRIFSGLFHSAAGGAERATVENFALGLGLSSKQKPFEFDPSQCPFFDRIRQEMDNAGGDLKLYSFYEKFTNPPYGVPVDLLSLYLVAFVRHSRPQCHIKIKPESGFVLTTGKAPRENRLGYTDVPLIQWTKSKPHKTFERLTQESGPNWNDYVDLFRELDETLQATESPEQVIAQQERLKRAFGERAKGVATTRASLNRLAQMLNEKIGRPLAVFDDVTAICGADAYHLQSFADIYKDRFDGDAQKFKAVFNEFRNLEAFDQNQSPAILDALLYLNAIGILPDGELKDERDCVRGLFKLNEFCEKPDTAAAALSAFNRFKDEYMTRYQMHYRDYREQMQALHGKLEEAAAVLQGLDNINSVGSLGKAVGGRLQLTHQELLGRTDASHLQSGIPDVSKNPVLNGVTLNKTAPVADVESFKGELEEAQFRCLELLSPPAIIEALSASNDAEIQELIAAIKIEEAMRITELFTRSVAAKVKDLLTRARMLVVEVNLSDFGPVHISDGKGEVARTVQQFERFLRNKLDQARKANPNKTVHLNLK